MPGAALTAALALGLPLCPARPSGACAVPPNTAWLPFIANPEVNGAGVVSEAVLPGAKDPRKVANGSRQRGRENDGVGSRAAGSSAARLGAGQRGWEGRGGCTRCWGGSGC